MEQPDTLHVPPTHVASPAQTFPQAPQFAGSLCSSTHAPSHALCPAAQVSPQTLGVPPPPQVWGAVHVPQSSMSPQPSGIWPQVAPCCSQVDGVQQAPPLQTPGGGQVDASQAQHP